MPIRCGSLILAGALLCLIGCNSADRYPSQWSPLARGLFAPYSNSCPDLSGTYEFVAEGSRTTSTGKPNSLNASFSFLAGAYSPRSGDKFLRFSQLKVVGPIDGKITVVLMRNQELIDDYVKHLAATDPYKLKQYQQLQDASSRAEFMRNFHMTNAQYEDNFDKTYLARTKTLVLKQKVDFECSHGWISQLRWDSYNFPSTIETLYVRDKSGSLIAREKRHEEDSFSWADSHTQLGAHTDVQWWRWKAVPSGR